MKISINDDVNTTLFLSKAYIDDIDFANRIDIEIYFKELFKKLKKFYNLDIKGFYDILIYTDKYYGTLILLKQEIVEYDDYFDNHIDMHFSIKEYSSFLYELTDLFFLENKVLDNVLIYFFNDHIYVRIIKKMDDIEMGRLIENSKIIYDDYINEVIKYGKIIKL
ncbi:MAG: hypothetical protein RR847_02000 [Bacilli bacterium]